MKTMDQKTTEKQSKDLVKQGPTRFEIADAIEVTAGGVKVTSFAQMKIWANEIAASGLTPKGMETEAKVMLAAQTGMELGFTLMRSLQAVVIVNGRATLMAEAALALIRTSGLLEPGTQVESGCRPTTEEEKLAGEGDLIGYTRTTRVGQRQTETLFSEKDAKIAGLWKGAGPWTKYPKRMLKHRSVGFHTRDEWSDLCNGLLMSDEAADIPRGAATARDVTPAPEIVTGGADPLIASLSGDPAASGEQEATWEDVTEANEAVDELDGVTQHELDDGESEIYDDEGAEVDPETGDVIPPEIR